MDLGLKPAKPHDRKMNSARSHLRLPSANGDKIRIHDETTATLAVRNIFVYLYNKRACPTKKEPQQGFLYLTIKMSSSEKFKSNAKTSTSTGILFLFYYFLIKSYLKELLRRSGSYKRFKKLKASKESTQVVTTKPDF